MEPLALFLLPLPPVESVGGALSRGHVTSSRFSIPFQGMTTLCKICFDSRRVLIDPLGTGRDYE